MAVRNFSWDDLPALVDFVAPARAGGAGHAGSSSATSQELRRRVFQETLAQPGLDLHENCFLFDADGQLQGFCRLGPELAIGRVVLELEVREANGDFANQVAQQLVRQAVARARHLGARVVHSCLPKESGRGRLLEEEGFTPSRVYWDMLRKITSPLTGVLAQSAYGAAPPPGTGMSGTTGDLADRPVAPISLPVGYRIRRFQPGDAQALTDAQNTAFGGSWGFCPNTVEQIQHRTSMSNTKHEGILFLCHGEQIAGYCWTCVAPANGETNGIICMMGVVPEYRGRNLSQPLLLAGMQYLWSIGVAGVGLQVDRSNTPAIRLYASAGFQKVAELQWFQLRLRPS